MKFDIETKDNVVIINYNSPSKVNYDVSIAHVKSRYFTDHEFCKMLVRDRKALKKFEHELIFPEAHRYYYNTQDLYLNELMWNLKALSKIYRDYLVLNYDFNGFCLGEDDKLIHNFLTAEEEDYENHHFNYQILGNPFIELVDLLKAQQKIGNIAIRHFCFELISHKARKPKRRKTNIPRGLRHEVFKRDNYTCVECGAKKEDGATLHVDHKIPVSKGGTDELDNLQTLCSDCNLNKSDVIQ